MPLNIIHITRPAQIGGTITSTLRQASAEHRLGRNVLVWSLLRSQRADFVQLMQRYPVKCRQLGALRCALGVTRIRFCHNQPVVHLHSGRCDASRDVSRLRSLLGSRAPLIVSLHGPTAWERHLHDSDWRSEHRRNARVASALIVPSEDERRVQIECGLDESKLFVVPDIVEEQHATRGLLRTQLGLTADHLVVGFCARLVREKGVCVLLRAFRRIHREIPNAVLVLAGQGPLMCQCEALAKEFPGYVFVLGYLSKVAPVYADADVYVAPSTGESFGISAIEAAMARVPMVLSRIPPWTNLFPHDRYCRFFDVGDEGALSSAVISVLQDLDSARGKASVAEAFVKSRFGEAATMDALERVYDFLGIPR